MSFEIKNLNAGYGKKQILTDINISKIERGQLVGIIGPNAAGKSTLFKSIAGVIPVTKGEIALRDSDLVRLSRSARAKRIAYMPQAYGCNAVLTVFESILLALKQNGGWRVNSDSLARVANVLSTLKLEHLSTRSVGALSGGQAQMVAVAQTLVRDPELILFDEPTSALDLKHQLQILSSIKQAITEKELVGMAALHDLNLAAQFCDRIILVQNGAILADGNPETVLRSDEIGRAYGVQTELNRSRSGRYFVEARLAKSA